MMRPLATKIFFLLLCCALSPPLLVAAQSGRLSGDLLFGMADYRAEVAGVEAEKMRSRYEQVTVRYQKEDLIRDERLGRYTLMLGYEFTALDPERVSYGLNDATVSSIRTDKLYYNASLLLAPGGLPFRLTLFARDLHRTTFRDATSSFLPVGRQDVQGGSASMIDPDLPIDVSNGTRREIGGTLLLGIRNGSYLGAYRDVLSHLPRLLIDFKQEEVNDSSSHLSPQHFRNRDLAFVSLNKGDNWVHFRMRDFVDFLNAENNSKTSLVMIGTIDHTLQRKWINMTNWVKISGDLSYRIEEEARRGEPKNTYLLNMMAVGKRQEVASTVFPRFQRQTDGRFITTEEELPMAVTVDLNRDTRLRSRLIYEAKSRNFFSGSATNTNNAWLTNSLENTNYRDLYLDNLLELQRSQRIIIKPRLEIESRSESETESGLALRLGAEVLSNSKQDKAFSWLGGYAFTTTRTTESVRQEDGSYIQNELYGSVDKNIDRAWRVGGRISLQNGSGEGRETIAFRIPTLAGGFQGSSSNGERLVDSNYGGTISRGDLSLYVDHRYQRLLNRLELGTEYFAAAGVSAQHSYLRHNLVYQELKHALDWKTDLNFGDNTNSPASVSFDYLQSRNSDTTPQASWHSDVRYSYDPSRKLGLTLVGGISGAATDPRSLAYAFSEKVDYRIFTVNGIIRCIAEFSEEFGYEKVSQSADGRGNNLYGRLAASYFPSKYLYLKIRGEMVDYLDSNALQQLYAAEFGAMFEKLRLIASYSEASKERESATLPQVTERRWDFKVKKFF